ncbi:hypothetical protein [Streptomyces plumbiresistens]|uniref:Uncharacterized protein n=1 Tax=Streptomyces plumbiresistens TaxID=511811 RepID=A0ABP7QFD9_9ACTN
MRHIDEFLARVLGGVDIGPWIDVPPRTLLDRPGMAAALADGDEGAARVLKYARCTGAESYDEIGFRSLAATPRRGEVPLQTFESAHRSARRQQRRALPPGLAALFDEQTKLRHRPLEPPDARLRYSHDGELLHLHEIAEAGRPTDGVIWSFPVGAPPRFLERIAQDADFPLQLSQYRLEGFPRTWWLPLPELLAAGRFERMQECRNRLAEGPAPGALHCFVSHRWLTPTTPDPDGLQARLTAWQLVVAVCEAVLLARRRGLTVPRRSVPQFEMAVGPQGSPLVESLVVNVLRYALDEAGLDEVYAEIRSLEKETTDHGVGAALEDAELARLRAEVAARPLLGRLLHRVRLWYDYSCMPQRPRTPQEQLEFEEGLRVLGAYQLVGRTVVLLDDADDYLGRAWCTLEVLTADSMPHGYDVLVGAHRTTVVGGTTEHYLETLLQDRAHVVWRAVLDTEVFAVQSPEECLRRLRLATTEKADVPVVYDGLRRLGAPRKVHIDDSELITGTLPLPLAGDGSVVVPLTASRPYEQRGPTATAGLDWSGALSVADPADGTRLDIRFDDHLDASSLYVPSSVELRESVSDACHVAVVAGCEAEAVLLSRWVLTRDQELRSVVDAPVGSLTWLATDIAPVGHFAEGVLRTAVIDAQLWVLVTTDVRLARCQMVRTLLNALDAAGRPYVTVSVDGVSDDGVEWHAPPDPAPKGLAARTEPALVMSRVWRGGLFRADLADELAVALRAGR